MIAMGGKEEMLKENKDALGEEIAVVKEEVVEKKTKADFDKENWKPKTSLGIKVKAGEITDIDFILDNKLNILEHQITDVLMPNLATELLLIGQSRGKFGGGQRRVFRQTQKKT